MKTTGNEHKKEIVLLELFSGIGGFLFKKYSI